MMYAMTCASKDNFASPFSCARHLTSILPQFRRTTKIVAPVVPVSIEQVHAQSAACRRPWLSSARRGEQSSPASVVVNARVLAPEGKSQRVPQAYAWGTLHFLLIVKTFEQQPQPAGFVPATWARGQCTGFPSPNRQSIVPSWGHQAVWYIDRNFRRCVSCEMCSQSCLRCDPDGRVSYGYSYFGPGCHPGAHA